MNELPTDQDLTGDAKYKVIAESKRDDTKAATLLSLPPELRLIIYSYAFNDHFSGRTVRPWQGKPVHALLAVCAEIRAEAWSAFVRRLEAAAVAAYDLSEEHCDNMFNSDTSLKDAVKFSKRSKEERNCFRVFSNLAIRMRSGPQPKGED